MKMSIVNDSPTEYKRNRDDELCWNTFSNTSLQKTVSVICPHCNKEVAAVLHIDVTHGSFSETESLYYVMECPACMKPIILDCIDEITFPGTLPFDNVKNLPENVSTIYNECRKSCGDGCFTASVLLARTLLNHIAVDNGAKENQSFKYYVDYLIENYMPKNSSKWVDAIRVLANDSAHNLEIMRNEQAELVIKFLMYLLKFIYELPNELT